MYANFLKRIIDFILSLSALVVLFPILLFLTIIGAVFMGGNPFFIQERPGKDEHIFKLIKFKSMNNRTDISGNLLPDEERLTNYGRFLRASSLDELPELINIIRGDMAIIGPRPLLPRDVAYMSKEQRKRHDVRPGLTGLAQCSGRNLINWDNKLTLDVKYVDNLSFKMDCEIFLKTIFQVLKREGITFEDGTDMDLKDWNELKRNQ